MRDTPKKATCLYLALTWAFSSLVWLPIIWSGHLEMGFGLMIPTIMWCPALGAFTTCILLRRDVRSLGWTWPKKTYLAAAYFLPLAYASFAYGAVWAWKLAGWNSQFVTLLTQDLGVRNLPEWASLAIYFICMATGGAVENLSLALGEEIGWRGFLVPELAKEMSFTKIGLLSGIVWAAWHFPLLMFADYNAGTNRWYALVCSSVTCISVGFILAWLRLKSNSIWPAALLHASHNLFVPGIFDNLTLNTGRTLWYTTEFGSALAITSSAVALYFWMRRSEVEPASSAAKLTVLQSIPAQAGAS